MQTGKQNKFVVYSHLISNSLLLAATMKDIASLAASREDANKKVEGISAMVSRLSMDPGPPRELGKYVTIDDGLNGTFKIPPSLCETPQVGDSLQDEASLSLTAG